MNRLILGLPALLLLSGGDVGARSIAERLDLARAEFEHKNFGNAIEIIEELLHPTVQLVSEDDIVQAREMLGLSYFYVGEREKAQEEFTLLLYLRPRHRLDAFLVPPPAVTFFDGVRNHPEIREKLDKLERENQERQRIEAEQREKTPPRTVVRRVLLHSKEIHRSRLLALLPLGLGQFQNGHDAKGIALAAGGGLALATNFTCYILRYALRKQKTVEGSTRYYYSNVSTAQGLATGQYVSLGLFLATWIYGAVDASVYFEPVTRTPPETLGEEDESGGAVPRATALFPVGFPAGAGLSFSTRF